MDKKVKIGVPIIATFLGVAGFLFYRLFRNTTGSANNVTANISEESVRQATLFYGYFGIVKLQNGTFAISTPTFLESTLQKIAWLIVNIVDVADVQRQFSALCGGYYTLLQAAKTALSTSNYTIFVNYMNNAAKQKRIFCKDMAATTAISVSGNVEIAGESFAANQYVGRLQGENDNYYSYISMNNGKTYFARKTSFIAIK